jgi:hypothetical protein
MKVSELKQIIKEEIAKVLDENSSKPTHISNVDWYYVTNSTHKSSATVPDDTRYDAPEGELYIKRGTVGYKNGNEFRDEDGNTVEFSDEYFTKLKPFIIKFKNWAVDNPTTTDIEFFARKYNLNSEQQYLLKKIFTYTDFRITPTGPLPSDIKPRIGN